MCFQSWHQCWEMKFVFRTGCVKITEVNADSDVPVFLEYGNNVINPIWVLFFSNESTFDEFFNFRFYCLNNVGSKSSLLLFNRFSMSFNIRQCMATSGSRPGKSLLLPAKTSIYSRMRAIRSRLSLGNRLSFIEIIFGLAWSPTSIWTTLSLVGGVIQNAFSIEG